MLVVPRVFIFPVTVVVARQGEQAPTLRKAQSRKVTMSFFIFLRSSCGSWVRRLGDRRTDSSWDSLWWWWASAESALPSADRPRSGAESSASEPGAEPWL